MSNMTLAKNIVIENDVRLSNVYTNNEYYINISSFNKEFISVPEASLDEASCDNKEQRTNDFAINSDCAIDMEASLIQINKSVILKKYFKRWQNHTSRNKERHHDLVPIANRLDGFITNLKNHQSKTSPKSPPSNRSKSSEKAKCLLGCFKNRFQTQKDIIDMQRSKIEEQTKIIGELKLGIIREDLLKTIEETKIDIRDIFSNCSKNLLTKAPLLKAADEREKIMIHSQKAPKSVQRMQQRAIERANYREIILVRKRLIEDARQKLLEEAIERKRALEEEERKRHLEIINEQRKKDLQMQKIRHEKKQKFERKLLISETFYNKLLIKQCFRKLFIYYMKSVENSTLSTEYYINKQKRWTLRSWTKYVEAKYKMKYEIADAHFKHKTLTKFFKKLKEFKLESVRSMQVAEDIYDFRLINNTFIHWHRYVCVQVMLNDRKIQIATKHGNRRLLFHCFYQWRSLPAVIQLEKAKEEKKRKWREKVWEILPDYQPPEPL